MHKDDLMTPVERARALARGESVDRLPVSIFWGAPAHSLLGWTRREEHANARSLADVQKKVYEVFGGDGVGVAYGLHGMAIAFGAKMTDPEHFPPAILEHPVKDINDLSMLDLERLTVNVDPTAKKCLESARILKDELGHEVPCGMNVTGAITCASALIGTKQLMVSLLRNPEQVHKLLDFITEGIIQLSGPFLQEGFGIMIADPVASGTLLTKERFREFVLPYSRRYLEGCKKFSSAGIAIHICGDTTKLLEDVADCSYSVFSLDNLVDLAVAKERVGSRMHLLGNVDPISVLYQGTPEQVRAKVRECCRKAWDNPCGYTISMGCDAAYGTPLENAFAFMDEARKCAKYPWNPENFQD